MNRNQALLFTSRPRKNHPWMRLENDNIHNAVDHQQRASRRSKMRLSADTSLGDNNNHPADSSSSAATMDHPEEPGAIAKRRTPTGNNNNNVSPRSSSMGTTTFQQYRQQRSVRKHPWRTDVKGRGSSNNKRGARSWRNLVKSAAPWDEVPTIIEEEEEWIARTESKDSETSVSCAVSATGDVVREVSGCVDTVRREEETRKEDPLLDDLQDRLKQVYQGDHYIVQGIGTGRGRRPAPAHMEKENAVRQQLVRALQDRLRNYYTGHLVSFETYGKQGTQSSLPEEKTGESSDENVEGSEEGSAASVDESVVSVQSMIVAATILNSAGSRKGVSAPQPSMDDDEWTEYTVESNVSRMAPFVTPEGEDHAARSSRPGPAREDPEDSEWEEYTVYDEETVATEALAESERAQLIQTMRPGDGTFEEQDGEDEYEWDEYTVETDAFQSRRVVAPSEEEEWDEYTIETIADALLSLPRALPFQQLQPSLREAPELERQASGDTSKSPSSIAETVKDIVRSSNSRLAMFEELQVVESVSYVDEIIEEDYDDDHWDDYTVETVADAFASLPRTLQLEFVRASTRNVHQDAEEEDEEEEDSSECSSQPPPPGAYEEPVQAEEDQTGDEWTEVTCEETIHDIPGILRQADSVKSVTDRPSKPDRKPVIADPTLSSTDSESENWHDARSAGSGEPSCVKEISSSASTGASSRSTVSGRRRTRSPPTNLNQILKKEIFSQNLSVVQGALRVLARKADDDLEYRAHIVRSGGILAVVRAMQQNAYKASVQVLACKTLQKIATDKENRVAIGEVGGVEAVVGALSEHMADESVAEATCVALWVLTSDCLQNQLSIETAALDVVVSCMRRYAKNPTIQEKAFQTLANLCLEHEEKLVALSQMGGFVVMSTALVLHWENRTVKNEAISTLSQLFGRLAVSQTA